MQGYHGDQRPDDHQDKSEGNQAYPGKAPIKRLLPRDLLWVARLACPAPRWCPTVARGGGLRAGRPVHGGRGLDACPVLGGALRLLVGLGSHRSLTPGQTLGLAYSLGLAQTLGPGGTFVFACTTAPVDRWTRCPAVRRR